MPCVLPLMMTRRDLAKDVLRRWLLPPLCCPVRFLDFTLLDNGFVRHEPVPRGHAIKASVLVIAKDQGCSLAGINRGLECRPGVEVLFKLVGVLKWPSHGLRLVWDVTFTFRMTLLKLFLALL